MSTCPWQDPGTLHINRMNPRASFIPYPDREGAEAGARDFNPFYKSLNGSWDFAYVENGDEIEIDLNACTIKLLVDDATLEERKKNFKPQEIHPVKGVLKSYREKVTGADEGALWL